MREQRYLPWIEKLAFHKSVKKMCFGQHDLRKSRFSSTPFDERRCGSRKYERPLQVRPPAGEDFAESASLGAVHAHHEGHPPRPGLQQPQGMCPFPTCISSLKVCVPTYIQAASRYVSLPYMAWTSAASRYVSLPYMHFKPQGMCPYIHTGSLKVCVPSLHGLDFSSLKVCVPSLPAFQPCLPEHHYSSRAVRLHIPISFGKHP